MHVIQHWNGSFFDKVPLRNLGMCYQVGHLIGEACPHPHPAFGNHFTIIDMNGIHNVALNFCSCMREHPLAAQLQHAWLFPATGIEPCTAVTMAALEQFQMLTFMGKISAYEYYYSLARLTDNTNTKTPSDNYDAFVWIVHEWSFIWQLKQAGIGNDPGGWKSAKLASCAVECLACPWLGVNILLIIDPSKMSSPDTWVYTLYLGIDGNFHLERFDVSSKEKDPGLGKGLAYFVDPTVFSSGVGEVVCTQHELKLPLSMIDLCVDEIIPHLVMSYNIACQWSINLDKHIKIYGDHLQPRIPNTLYLVLKFHLPGHIEDCQEKFCMSFHTQVGNNDGEAPERGWAISNGVATSTRKMGPGHQHEKLNQHFGDYNWQKNIPQGNSLLQKLKDAVPKASKHTDRCKHFMRSLPQQDVTKWTEMVEAWEADRMKPNPFAWTVANKTEAAMHLQLAQDDAQDELAGLNSDDLHTTLPKDMISQGIQLEASQSPESSSPQEVEPPLSSNRDVGYDLLHTIWSQLLALSKAYKDGNTNVLMQKEQLKCHKVTQDLNARITQAKQYYHDVRKRLMVLFEELGEWSWQVQLRILEDSDVWRISDDEVCKLNGARHVHEPTGGEKKCTLDYEANLWLSQASSTPMGGTLVNAGEGVTVYAKRQASIQKLIQESFEKKWWFVDEWIVLGD
ncbi:hypothetical protein EDD18DRAFT_1109315 [Armillaria luteobubalina]|uniref:CxC2-like cysteine cluster KDZ transposase-associated domain-containing protein n=1 Tax=Armillaria luteobubalina TaxID=153913 RepID=A0AA39PY73_9AGAR|nr:hypothetical protein EDD18DRAFT_1109315 [Armillaria luteobubalina]